MDNIKNDLYYVKKIKDDLVFIIEHMKETDQDELSQNEVLQDSMMFRLIQISESSRKLSEDYKRNHPSVPWTAMCGLRNRIVHDYGNVDLSIIYDTLKNSIPELLEVIEERS